MRIRGIKIENVRGISLKEISCDIHPNTPTFFVAPNGFGKTSIARAFNSMNRNRIELHDDDRFQNKQAALPLVEITDETGNAYLANSTSNTISNVFSIGVINSQVKPKATTRNFGGFASSTPALVVEPIVLYNNIPNKSEFTYSFSTMKRGLGNSAGKLLINLKEVVKDPVFVRHFSAISRTISTGKVEIKFWVFEEEEISMSKKRIAIVDAGIVGVSAG